MRLVSFGPSGAERLGALIDGGRKIVDLNAVDAAIPSCMIPFLQGDFWERTRRILADTSSLQGKAVVAAEKVRLGAPVPRPGQIICIGLNYKDHADEQGHEYPKVPLLFGKSPMAACGPNDDVEYPEGVEQLDYEVELGVIIGRTAKKVSAADARKHIAGYCVFHDVSARCCQFGDKQWFRGKSFDTFAPFGPALVTPDEAGDPHALKLSCKVNGEVRQDSSTSKLIHSVDAIIAYISRGITLQPGDVIATGTPSGVGVFLKPPRLLKRGDVVELEVQNLGKVVNKVV
ncbi:MAG TPA: fumarylacetoacetate hydrolase family protein [Planctomycetota bacterium]|nr:fumarylacetoacetate hydrolase family protein [Planctomycetota bacterium]